MYHKINVMIIYIPQTENETGLNPRKLETMLYKQISHYIASPFRP